MSYPIHKKTRGATARTTRTEKGFWGLELGEDTAARSFSRAVDTENMIWEGDGLRVRNGYRSICRLNGKINGIFYYKEQIIVHAGSGLYQVDSQGEQEPILLWDQMADRPSSGVVRRQTITRRWLVYYLINGWRREQITDDFLFIIDGEHYLFYDGKKVRSVADPYWGEDVINLVYFDGVQPEYFSTVPFTTVAKIPKSAMGDTDPRGDNRLSQFRCESFYVDTTPQTDFIVNCPRDRYNERIPEELQVRDTDGVWRTWRDEAGSMVLNDLEGHTKLILPEVYAGMNFLVDGDYMINVGTGALYAMANDGMDNFRIIYAVYKDPPTMLDHATVQCTYGADGKDNVLFLGASDVEKGADAFSAANDFFCFYETSFEVLGDSKTPITGYCRLKDGRLAVLKDDDRRAGVYFRNHTIVELGATQAGDPYRADAFPSVAGAGVAGCVNPHTVGIAGNEPCFLSKEGLFSVRSVSDELINLNETIRRSRAIDPFLERQDLSKARSVCWRGKYLIAWGDVAMITDGLWDSGGSYRYLKWRFHFPVTALGVIEGKLYLGSEEGDLFAMEETDFTDDGKEIEAFWQTPVYEDSSGRKLLLRKAYVACTAASQGALEAIVYRDGCPEPPRNFSLQIPDFSNWDFGKISFSGKGEQEWLSLLTRSVSAAYLYFRFTLKGNEAPLLWGVRLSYEKGGWVK